MDDSSAGLNFLPLLRGGNFLQDACFQDFQKDFSSAVDNVMTRMGPGRSLLADRLSCFRNPAGEKASSSSQESKTASISESQDSYVIVLDMSDYVNGSIAVKTRGQYAVVEASYKSNKFNRRFLLPKVTNFDGVTSAMSNEGILTVTAPKKGKAIEVRSDTTTGSPSSKPSLKSDIGEPITDKDGSAAAASLANTEGDRDLSVTKKGKFLEDSYFENVWKDFEKAVNEMALKESKEKAESRQQMSSDISSGRLPVPLYNRLNSYRNLREWAPINETQAVTLTQDSSGYKIVMDVKNFVGGSGDISLKAADGILVITGTQGPLSFKRDFKLPGLKNPNQITASLSDDGIITVKVSL